MGYRFEKIFHPDLGLQCLKQGGKNTNFSFLPFKIFTIARIGDKLYSTTSNTRLDDTTFAVSIDFSEDIYYKLLKLMPESIANSLKQIFEGEFLEPRMTHLPFPIAVGIEARLGELITDEDEQYIPFVAIKVFKTE